MTRLIHIEASPRGRASTSSAIAARMIEALAPRVPRLEIDRCALWAEDLPAFDGPTLEAKYAVLSGHLHNAEQAAAWSRVGDLVRRLDAADIVLVSTPMWNLGVPYRLKHFIDLVTQPGLSFSFDPSSGYRPLLEARPAIAILASAGDYSAGPSFGREDLASPYLRAAFGFIGLTDLTVIPVGPTAGPPPAQEVGRRRAEAIAAQVAAAVAGTWQ